MKKRLKNQRLDIKAEEYNDLLEIRRDYKQGKLTNQPGRFDTGNNNQTSGIIRGMGGLRAGSVVGFEPDPAKEVNDRDKLNPVIEFRMVTDQHMDDQTTGILLGPAQQMGFAQAHTPGRVAFARVNFEEVGHTHAMMADGQTDLVSGAEGDLILAATGDDGNQLGGITGPANAIVYIIGPTPSSPLTRVLVGSQTQNDAPLVWTSESIQFGSFGNQFERVISAPGNTPIRLEGDYLGLDTGRVGVQSNGETLFMRGVNVPLLVNAVIYLRAQFSSERPNYPTYSEARAFLLNGGNNVAGMAGNLVPFLRTEEFGTPQAPLWVSLVEANLTIQAIWQGGPLELETLIDIGGSDTVIDFESFATLTITELPSARTEFA